MPRGTQQPAGTPPVAGPVRVTGNSIPDNLVIMCPGVKEPDCKRMAMHSAAVCRTLSPRLSGRAAEGIKPVWGHGWFGVKWDRPYLWYQEGGTKPHTMRNLAGKTIPMWVDDWTGALHRANPKADTRITANGRRQIKIFRKVAKIGARKRVAVRGADGRLIRWREVPASYPGAPGRISHREWLPDTKTGRIVRLTSRSHVGVRWRHPGLVPREFMQHALVQVAWYNGLTDVQVHAGYGRH